MGKNAQRLRWVLGLTGVAVVLLMAYTGYQALRAKQSLELVADKFEAIATDLKQGDSRAARANLDTAESAAADAKDNTEGPGWLLTSRLPGVGDDVRAVRTVADVTDVLAGDVLPDIVAASQKLDPDNLRPRGGRIDVRPLEEVAPSVVAADQELQRQTARVEALSIEGLNSQLAGPVEMMQERLREAASLSAKASYAVRLLPSMLGQDGRRTYLVLFQNNAEVRATGGIPGAFATLTADHGRISLGRQASTSDLGALAKPALPLTREERALFEDKMALFPQNVNFTPDFPRSGELAQAMWRRATGATVDGVVSVDPVALSYILRGVGPVELPGGARLTADNAVPLLLNKVYERLPDPRMQDLFFAAAARGVFDKLAAGHGDASAVLEGLSQAVGEGRIYAWSAKAEEQKLLERAAIGGQVPRQQGKPRPFVGVFLNDGTGAKMEYYLDHRVDVAPVSCNTEGRQELEVTVTLTSSAPEDARALPSYIVGMAKQLGIRPGSMRLNVHLYAPIGGWIDSATQDDDDMPLSEGAHDRHPVGTQTVELAPGQTHTLTYRVMTGLHQPGDVNLRVTPGVRGPGIGEVGSSACSPG